MLEQSLVDLDEKIRLMEKDKEDLDRIVGEKELELSQIDKNNNTVQGIITKLKSQKSQLTSENQQIQLQSTN